MKNRNGMDAFSLLSDILFEATDGPIPSFVRQGPALSPKKAADSKDIVGADPSLAPAQ
jgi:hypothetical protein